MADSSTPDLRDIEIKLGRKVPESLARSLREEHGDWKKDATRSECPLSPAQSSTLERLESKLQLLRQDMIYLRATDVKLMRQLLIINESIESIKYMMEEKDIVASQGSSLSGSLCSLLESRESSLQGSYTSLHGYSDGMDEISVGSYLDTLADIVPGHCTPDFEQYNDEQRNGDDYQPLSSDSNHQYDEYYCFR
ncbi:leucine rich adaptor protein 1-like [Bufo gargarizans]|uniref:leucine rich adaptor protein 1-like n=1 Tax=Bufo bufo TaxID=8384 RepID=UPI001ABDC8F5|nr:leucine rich adaptor protein 1-like [Bufo bufo]XP_044142971.1 leucine rich adaptor protein 1-like [Bufo gargarizans]